MKCSVTIENGFICLYSGSRVRDAPARVDVGAEKYPFSELAMESNPVFYRTNGLENVGN